MDPDLQNWRVEWCPDTIYEEVDRSGAYRISKRSRLRFDVCVGGFACVRFPCNAKLSMAPNKRARCIIMRDDNRELVVGTRGIPNRAVHNNELYITNVCVCVCVLGTFTQFALQAHVGVLLHAFPEIALDKYLPHMSYSCAATHISNNFRLQFH